MRSKRSKDTRLVDKFSKQRDSQAAESQQQRSSNPTTSNTDDFTQFTGKEEEELKARNFHFPVVIEI